MAVAPVAIRRWAAAHAATVHGTGPRVHGTGPSREGGQPRPGPPAPAVIAAVSEPRTWLTEHDAYGVAAGVTLDGEVLLAVGERDGSVGIWDAEAGQLWQRLAGHEAAVYTVDFGYEADGRLLMVSGDEDGTVRIWEPVTGALLGHLARFVGDSGALRPSIAVVCWGQQPDGRLLLAVACTDNTVRVWDSGRRDWLCVLPGPSLIGYRRNFTCISWSYDHQGRRLLLAGRRDGKVVTWDAGTWEMAQVLADDPDPARAVASATGPDGSPLLATTRFGSSVIGLRTQRGDGSFTSRSVDPGQGQLGALAWVPLGGGRLILVGIGRNSLFILDGHTLAQLFAAPIDTDGRGVHNLGWAMRPDGRLVVSATSAPRQVYVWTITFDPPATPPAPYARAPADVTGPAAWPGRRWPPASQDLVVDPPEDVSPAFLSEREHADAASVKCTVLPDGRVVAAVRYFTRGSEDETAPVGIWDVTSGALVHRLTGSTSSWSQLSWGRLADGTPVLVTAADDDGTGDDGTVQLWDAEAGRLIRQRSGMHDGGVRDLALVHDVGGRPLLVTGGRFDQAALIWDASTFDPVRELPERAAFVSPLLEGRLADGTHCLVTGGQGLRIWDLASGELMRELTDPGSPAGEHTVWCAAWGEDPDGRPELASGSGDGAIHIWDPGTGQPLRTIRTPHGIVYTLAWVPGGRRHSVLVSAGQDRTVRIWDPLDGSELNWLPAGSQFLRAVDLVRHPNGDLLLVVAEKWEDGQGPAPFSVRRLATRPAEQPAGQPASRPAGRTRLTARLSRELPAWLLRLGRGDLWPPLGLVADLVAVTGPAVTGGPLAVLESEPGVARLRALGWPPAARVAFAAMLSSELDLPARYRPPGDDLAGPAADASPPADQVRAEALAHALRGQVDGADRDPPWRPDVAGLRAAAAAVTDQAVALLLILGPGACAADPLLPLRLARYVPRLPALSPRELRLVASVNGEYAVAGQAAAGTLSYWPGTAGLARSGPPARLLPTQLALPRDLLTVRLAEDQLLYRQHRAPAPPAPQPVTIILDTTPPTFGPAGNTLRTAAHLIARTLWSHGRQPALITLDRPETVTELRSPADLMPLWASATLDDPAEALASALRTAVSLGQPAVCCTHYRTARDHYRAGRATRLLTTHQPPEAPPLRPAGPWHAHLPPDPAGPELARAIAMLLGSHATAGEPA